VLLWFVIKLQKLLICYVFGGVSSKLPWLGIDMTITSKAFSRTCITDAFGYA
jgi:hypothetical protein